jgi:hypothetical protein
LNWDFKKEMIKYCMADVEVLSRSMLKFRKMFMDNLDVDPFRYITLSSLCMNIYLKAFMPDKSIVARDSNKLVSKTSSEWFNYINNHRIKRERLVYVGQDKIKGVNIHEGKIKNEEDIKCLPCGDAINETIDINKTKKKTNNKVKKEKVKKPEYESYYKLHKKDAEEVEKTYYKFNVDGLDRRTKTVYEFDGCRFHGCRKCFSQANHLFNKTVEKINILIAGGYTVITMKGCEWDNVKNKEMDKEDKQYIEKQAADSHIEIRKALFGGRTEGFKSYVKCQGKEKIYYYDVVSLYPTVNALDDYAVGFKQSYIPTQKEILNGSFIGIVKCVATPNRNLYVPVLPESKDGKLLFHLERMTGVWSSVELKKALEMGYKLDIISGFKYKKYTGLMKGYVEFFLKIKTCNSEIKTLEECNILNERNKKIGLDMHINPKDTAYNPGMKTIAKLCLNSLWGKFGQRPDLDSVALYGERDYNKLIKKIVDVKTNVKSFDLVGAGCLELKCGLNSDDEIEAGYISEITAIFTTANARMRLYDMLSWLDPSQLIYCDTDSVIFIYDEDNPLHKKPSNDAVDLPKSIHFGKSLGSWENELGKDEWITEIVIGGAKSYSYKTNKKQKDGKGDIILNVEGEAVYKTVIRQKGISLDTANSDIFTFEAMCKMVLNDDEEHWLRSEDRFSFSVDNKTKDVITLYLSRSVKSTMKQKRDLFGYNSYPFGYVGVQE